jgi:hypothetical protein
MRKRTALNRAESPQPTIMSELPEMNHHRRPILIDTDTASDDAVALIMALRGRSVTVVPTATAILPGNQIQSCYHRPRSIAGGSVKAFSMKPPPALYFEIRTNTARGPSS